MYTDIIYMHIMLTHIYTWSCKTIYTNIIEKNKVTYSKVYISVYRCLNTVT